MDRHRGPSSFDAMHGAESRRIARAGALLVFALAAGCAASPAPLATVASVDLERYAGRWYEIASFPQRFQRGCVATTATYSLRGDGRIRVQNECRDESFDGELRRIEGVAWVAKPESGNAKLQVQFFWPFRGDYWIIELDRDYRVAVVGNPSREYLWILSRTPTLDETLYRELLSRVEAQGFDTSRLQRTPQPPG